MSEASHSWGPPIPAVTSVDDEPAADLKLDALFPVSLEPYVALDVDRDGSTWLTNLVTAESLKLAGAGWELLVHPVSHRVVAYQPDADEGELPITADVIFTKKLFRVEKGSFHVIIERPGVADVHADSDARMCRFREGRFSFSTIVLAAEITMQVCAFLEPRACGNRLFMDLPCIYKRLELTQYKGKPSK